MYRIESALQEASIKFEKARDAMATVSAYSMTGSPSQLTSAAAALEKTVSDANESSHGIRRLMRHLGAENMPEAATRLCNGGRPGAARGMMRLHALASDMKSAQSGIDAFIGECLQSIRTAQGFIRQETKSGRLIGSA